MRVIQKSKLLAATIILIAFSTQLFANYKVLVLLPNKYGANFFLNKSNFEKYGWEITIAGTTRTVSPCNTYALQLGCQPITVDTLVNEIESVESWDCVAVMSGSFWSNYPNSNPCGDLLASSAALNIVSEAAESGLIVIGFCTGVRVLAAANVLNGLRVTGNPNYIGEYTNAGAIWMGQKRPPVIQGNIITSTAGDFYNIHNCAAIIRAEALLSKKAGRKEGKSFSRKNEKNSSNGAWAAAESSDGGCVTAGFSYNDSEESDFYFAKFSEDGELENSNQISIPGWQFATGISKISSTEYVAVGYGEDSFGSFDAFLIKIDEQLNVIWTKQFGDDGYNIPTDVCVLNNGSIAFSGYAESSNSTHDDFWIVITNSSGEEICSTKTGCSDSEMFMGIAPTSDGNMILVGNEGNFETGSGNRNAVLALIGKEGEIIWKKTYSSPDSDYTEDDSEWGVSVAETSDGGFLLVGHHDTVYEELKNGFVLKVDSEGNELWRRSIGEGTFYDGIESVITYDDRFYISGFTTSKTTGEKGYFIQCDDEGHPIEKRIIGQNNALAFHDLVLANNKIIAVGQEYPNQKSSNITVQVLKELATSINSVSHSNHKVKLFPNPASDKISIVWEKEGSVSYEISTYNIIGQKLSTLNGKIIGNVPMVFSREELNIKEEINGIFLIRVKYNGNEKTFKVLFN